MLVLDIKRTKEDFLKKKGKSSVRTFKSYTQIFNASYKYGLIIGIRANRLYHQHLFKPVRTLRHFFVKPLVKESKLSFTF